MSESTIYKTIVGTVAGIATTSLAALAFQSIWNWFVVPPFGAPHLSLLHSIGVLYTIGFCMIPLVFMTGPAAEKFQELGPLTKAVCKLIVYLMAWGVAWAWSLVIQ